MQDDKEAALRYLRQLSPGRQELAFFTEFSRLMVLTTTELVCIRDKGGKIEVLLTKRPDNEVWWPGQWHSPGATILASDKMEHETDFCDSIERVVGKGGELGGIKCIGSPVYLTGELRKTIRGTEYSAIHYVRVDDSPAAGTFFTLEEVETIKDNLVVHHYDMLQRVVAIYRMRTQPL